MKIKDLFIENIPNIDALKAVLDIVGDDSWAQSVIKDWWSRNIGCIYYSKELKEYRYPTENIEQRKNGLTVMNYSDFYLKYSPDCKNSIEDLKLNEITIIKDSVGCTYKVLRVQNGYIYTNESNNMCFVPSNKILI